MIEFVDSSTVWGAAATLGVFALASFLQKRTKLAWCNPILLGSMFLILFLRMMKIPYPDYKESTSVLTYLLFPATVSLAIPLYEQWAFLRKNIPAILAGIASGVVTSLGSILLLAWLFQLDAVSAVSLLPKSVTTAIGVDIAAEFGGMIALTTAVIVLTGMIGNLLAVSLCRFCTLQTPSQKASPSGLPPMPLEPQKPLKSGKLREP